MREADIFVLTDTDGNLLPPLVQASLLAKYSRSTQSLRELMVDLDEAKAAKFQEKWVVGYGHSSVAELASIPVCFEGVSIVASKFLESMARPGCVEKSTRMVPFCLEDMYLPEFEGAGRLADTASTYVGELFDLYAQLLSFMQENNPTGAEGAVQVSRAGYDVARMVLPAGVRTNLAMNMYPRDLAALIKRLLNRCGELAAIGASLKKVTEDIGGPLIRHCEPDGWSGWDMSPQFEFVEDRGPGPFARLLPRPASSTDRDVMEYLWCQKAGSTTRFMDAMNSRPVHAPVPDMLRAFHLTYHVRMDYGGWRDLQRHRRMFQDNELHTTAHGFVPLPEFIPGSLRARYVELMEKARQVVSPLWPFESQYIIPMSFLHDSVFGMDVSQVYYLTELRTQPQGHISYRRIAWNMVTEARKVLPWAMSWCRAIEVL